MGKDCKYCGAYISADLNVCPACGKKVRAEKTDETDAYTYYNNSAATVSSKQNVERENNNAYTYKQEYERRYGENAQRSSSLKKGEIPKRGKRTASVGEEEVKDRFFSCLSYFGILFLIPYIFRRDSEFVRFHCNQGLVLLLFSLVLDFAEGLLMGWLVTLVGTIFKVVCVIMGLVNVANGKKTPLPLIGQITILK